MSDAASRAVAAEAARIRDAYGRRVVDERYSLVDAGHLFLIQDLERHLLEVLRREGLTPLRERTILEVGSGSGFFLREFVRWGATPANLCGVELLPERLAEARARGSLPIRLVRGDGARLPLRDGSMDVVFQATMFSSVLDDAVRRGIAAEMLRVLRPGGVVLWYDYQVDNPRNPDVRGVPQAEIAALFPGCRLGLRRVTLAPPLGRRLARVTWLGSMLLARVPWLCTHTLGVIRKG